MIVDWTNVHLSREFYVHDCVFSGFKYDYDNRAVMFEMINQFDGIVLSFQLNNVIMFNMQSCSFWHGGNAVYHIRCYSEHPFFQQLDVVRNENISNLSGSYLDLGINYIVFSLQVNSGDIYLAICESVEYLRMQEKFAQDS